MSAWYSVLVLSLQRMAKNFLSRCSRPEVALNKRVLHRDTVLDQLFSGLHSKVVSILIRAKIDHHRVNRSEYGT
jgi:hypothetical protein